MNEHSVRAVVAYRARRAELSFWPDSGVMYTCLPEPVSLELGLTPKRRISVLTAHTDLRSADVAECVFEFLGGATTTPVILGRPEDVAILGEVTLTELGLIFDPFSRRIERGTFPMTATTQTPARLHGANNSAAARHSLPLSTAVERGSGGEV